MGALYFYVFLKLSKTYMPKQFISPLPTLFKYLFHHK